MKIGDTISYRFSDTTRTGVILYIDWNLDMIKVRLINGGTDFCSFNDIINTR